MPLFGKSSSHSSPQDDMFKTLVKHGIWSESRPDIDTSEALLRAAQHGNHVCVSMLLGVNANVSVTDRLGRSPLLLASTNDKDTNIELLLNAGADADATDKNGWTCIMWACREDRQKNVELLLLAGGDPSAGSNDGWAPLSVAAHYGRKNCTKFLLAAGADTHATNDKHETAWDLAKRAGHKDILKILEASLRPPPCATLPPAPPPHRSSHARTPPHPALRCAAVAAAQAQGGGAPRQLRNPRHAARLHTVAPRRHGSRGARPRFPTNVLLLPALALFVRPTPQGGGHAGLGLSQAPRPRDGMQPCAPPRPQAKRGRASKLSKGAVGRMASFRSGGKAAALGEPGEMPQEHALPTLDALEEALPETPVS